MNQGDVYEIAQLSLKPDSRAIFEENVKIALDEVNAAPGCQGAHVFFGIENPDEPCFVIRWDSVEAHEDFRGTPGFAAYRAAIGDTFAAAPTFRHFTVGPN